jgi:hypothetical protein
MRLINHGSGFNGYVGNSLVRPACTLGGRYPHHCRGSLRKGPGSSRSFTHVVFQIPFISEKKNLNKSTQSMSPLSPQYLRLISSSLYSNMLQLLPLSQRQTRRTQQPHSQLPQWHRRPRSFSYTSTKQARCDGPRLLSFQV